MNRRLLIFILSGLFLLLAVPLAQAGLCGCPGTEVDSVSIRFSCDNLRVSWSHGSGTDSVLLIVNGSTFELITLQFLESPSGSHTVDFNPPLSKTTTVFIFIVVFESEENIAQSMAEVHCKDEPDGESQRWPCADGRLTYTLCQPLVVYPVISEDGVGWTIYRVEQDSAMGQFMFYVPAEVFDSLPDEIPANCTIDRSDNGQVVLYRLTSGQYQINVGPDHEGKVFVYIFNDLTSAPVSIDTYVAGMRPEILPSCV
jgi:hypothetical protein